RLGLESRFVLITVGRNHPKKGFHLVPEIAKRLKGEIPNLFWLMVGRGMGPIAEAVKSAGLEGSFRFGDEIKPADLHEYWVSSDCFVFPTLTETFGLVNIEAMASGVPVISANADGCRDVIDSGVDGILCKIGDPKDFATAILKVY